MQTATCPTCLVEKPLDASGRIAMHTTPTHGIRLRLRHNRCPGGGMIFVGVTLDMFRPHAPTAPEALYWADDCDFCFPDHGGTHEAHCRYSSGGGAG